MAVDTASHIGNFDTTLPANTDTVGEADDNFRHVKTVLKTDFAAVTGAVTATHTELNKLAGFSGSIQSTTLTDGKVWVGNGSNVATAVTLSGDVTTNNAGVTAIASGVIVNADVNASAAIDATKIANGAVSNTEFQYLDGVTSAIQTQLNTKIAKFTWSSVSINTTIVAGNGYYCGSSNLDFTLPDSPTTGDRFAIIVEGSSSRLLLAASGEKVNGAIGAMTLTSKQMVQGEYTGVTGCGWAVMFGGGRP